MLPFFSTKSRGLLRQSFMRNLSSNGKLQTLQTSGKLSGSILLDTQAEHGTATVTLNRPKAFNSLNKDVVQDLKQIFDAASFDPDVRALVLTGSEKFFAAGADIKEMLEMNYSVMRDHDRNESLLELKNLSCSKPIIAAVNGFAFGGGCELAMLCDIIIAGQNAKFGQPEINLGIMAGAGGTQRLTKVVGKSLSMQMNLTGDPIDAQRALQAGLVSEVLPVSETLDRAQAIAKKIAAKSSPAARKIKAMVLKSYNLSLDEGCTAEHDAFITCWATQDQKEGMTAFAEKRSPNFRHD